MNLEDLKKVHREATKAVTSLGNAVRTVVKSGKVTFLPEDKVMERIEMCHNCIYYQNGRCGLCNCVCSVKARVLEFECPLGCWDFERVPTEWTYNESQLSIIPMAFYRDNENIYAYVKNQDGITRFETSILTKKTQAVKIS